MHTRWNVSVMAYQSDNGYCLTYPTEAQARAVADALVRAGAYSVTVWQA